MAIWRKCFTVAILLLAARSSAQELVKVPVQIPAITPAVTPFAVARDRGYYRQEGLDVQLVVMPSALGSQALLGGNVKFSTAGGAGLLPILRGAPVRFMFTSFSRPMFWLYSRSDIRSVESLKGKKVGVSSLGSGPDSLLREILKKHGLEGGRDVAIMAVGSGTARFFALQAGSVDAAMLSIGQGAIARINEAHDVVIQAWTKPGPFRYEGKHFHYRHVNPWVLPSDSSALPFFWCILSVQAGVATPTAKVVGRSSG